MGARRWQVVREGGSVRLHRPGAGVMDVSVVSVFPNCLRPIVLAHEVRKDLWRMLQRLRGFSPVVAVAPCADGWRVTAGGQVRSAVWPRVQTERQLRDLLDDPARRRRWIAHARVR